MATATVKGEMEKGNCFAPTLSNCACFTAQTTVVAKTCKRYVKNRSKTVALRQCRFRHLFRKGKRRHHFHNLMKMVLTCCVQRLQNRRLAFMCCYWIVKSGGHRLQKFT